MATISASMVKELRTVTGAAMMDCKKALTESDGDLTAAQELLRKKGQATAVKKSGRETKEGAISIQNADQKVSLIKVACETDFVAINQLFKDFIDQIAQQANEVGADGLMEKTTTKGPIKEQFVEAIAKMGENMAIVDGITWDINDNSAIGHYTHSNRKIGVLVELQGNKNGREEKIQSFAKDVAMHIAASNVEAISEKDLDPEYIEKERKFLIDQAADSGKPANIIEKMVEGRLKKFKKEICLLNQNFIKDPDITISQFLENASKEVGTDLKVERIYKSQF